MDAVYVSNATANDGSIYRGSYSPNGQISLTEYAFKLNGNVSFDQLNSVYQKELWQKTRFLSGKFYYDLGDNFPAPFKYHLAAEDAFDHAFLQKNAGAFPSLNNAIPDAAERGFRNFFSLSSQYSRHFFRIWEHQGVNSFIYKIPRRFRNILTHIAAKTSIFINFWAFFK